LKLLHRNVVYVYRPIWEGRLSRKKIALEGKEKEGYRTSFNSKRYRKQPRQEIDDGFITSQKIYT